MSLRNSTAVSPNSVALNIDATTNNFSMIINGGTCYGYKLFITDTDNVAEIETVATLLSTPIYDTNILSVDWDISALAVGNTYKWYAQLYANTATITMTIASPCVVTWTAHGLSDDDQVIFSTTGALPTGLSIDTYYYVINSATNTFQLSLTSGGVAIDTSGSQSGVHTALDDLITDQSYIFYSDSVPTLGYTPTPLGTSPSLYYDVEGAIYTVRGTYSQLQSVPIKSWYFSLYNSVQTLIQDYDISYNQNIVQEFDGLLDNISYWIQFAIVTENGYESVSEKIKLIVDYDDIAASIDISASNNFETSGILIEWGGFVYILGVEVGAAPNYTSDFIYSGNYGLDPQSDIEVEDFSSDTTFNYQFIWGNKNTGVDGDIMVLENTVSGESLTVTYNNAGTQMELYYNTTLIDTVSFSAPTVGTGTWEIFITSVVTLSQATLKITDGV